jgi:uroporphyrinogen-III synthase
MRIIVTRPRAQAAAWVHELQGQGVAAEALPLIDIGPPADPSPVVAAWGRLDGLALVMFVSANAVQHFFELRPASASWPSGLQAASTGPGTTAALRRAGLDPTQIVEPAPEAGQYDSEALWARIAARPWAGRQVLVVRGEDGRDWLSEQWREQGASVQFVAAYCRQVPQFDDREAALLARALAEPRRHLWVFSSSEAVQNLAAATPGADWSDSRALGSHPRIVQAARDLGFGVVDEVAPNAAAVASAVSAGGAALQRPS